MNGEHNIKARRWLEYARGDLQSARALVNTVSPLRNICYFAQQSAEKSLKALAALREAPIVRTHDLDLLALRLPSEFQKELIHLDLSWLSEWSIEARYPGEWAETLSEDAEIALQIAEELLSKADAWIQLKQL